MNKINDKSINYLTEQKNNKLKTAYHTDHFNQLNKLENKFENIEYCSNSTYKIIITIILVGILIYFIWFVSRKKYFEDSEYITKTNSTPFN